MRLKGSVRSGGNTHVLELMRATENTFVDVGGHAAAGGFTVIDTAVFFLEDRLVEAHERLTKDATPKDDLAMRADAEVTPEDITDLFLARIEKFSPFGMQNPKPVFLLRGVVVQKVSHFGKAQEHLKLHIDAHEGRTIDGVTFFVKGAVKHCAESMQPGSHVHILAHLERDTFSRGTPVRLRLLDIRLV